MVLDQQTLTYDPAKDGSMDDFIARVTKIMESMKKQSFDARPLPPSPRIMTIPPEASMHDNIDLWSGTCPVCRPLVKDLHLLNSGSRDLLLDNNTYIQWHLPFLQLSSALARDEISKTVDKVQEMPEPDDTGMLVPHVGNGKSKSSSNSRELHAPVPCPFCAYFACLMFDDPGYTFFIAPGCDSLKDEMKCCCSKSLSKSERVSKVAKKLKGYAEQYGPDAGISFIIQPADYDPADPGFGKLRFQAHTRSPNLKYNPVAIDPASWHEIGNTWLSH